MLSKGDEFPIHQTPEPIAFSGTDRNFYDRYFFSGYQENGEDYFAIAFGVYPHLNIADAHLSVLRNGTQVCIHASRLLGMERMDLAVGPIRIEVIEPLQKVRLVVDNHQGVSADLTFEGRSFPFQEPRFIRRQGPRLFFDYTRFTQGIRWNGWIEIDGKRRDYRQAQGTRDRSWGIRRIGARDPQPIVPVKPMQFFWIWTPTSFSDRVLYAHVNEDGEGQPWNTRAAIALDGAAQGDVTEMKDPRYSFDWKSGTRHAASARLDARDAQGNAQAIVWTPVDTFQMKGIGYGHPEWSHGGWKGELSVEREDFAPASLDPLKPENLHIQAICTASFDHDGKSENGIGMVEQLVIGPHAPSGFGRSGGAR